MTRFEKIAVCLALLFSLGAPRAGRADVTTQARVRLTPAQRPALSLTASGPRHELYGRIARLAEPYFTLVLRSGRVVNVDAAEAISSGRYSAPLFVGKTVLVTGKLDRSGVLHSDTVTRLTALDRTTRLDR